MRVATARADGPGIAAAKLPPAVERAAAWAEHALPRIWADQVSRWCLLAAVASIWMALTLGAPLVLLPAIAACVGLWKRREKRAEAAADLTDPDFF